MRVMNQAVKCYYMHKTLTPQNVRFTTSGELLPEVGDKLSGLFGDTGEEIIVTVVGVTWISESPLGYQAYDVKIAGTEPAPSRADLAP